MQHIANNPDALALQGLGLRAMGIEMVRKRVEIEQALAGVAVLTIPTIQHNGALAGLIQLMGQLRGDIGAAMANHQHICPHRDIGARCIKQRFAFAQRAARRRKTLYISG